MKERNCRPIVTARADGFCERCGVHASARGLTLHHRVKRGQGGPWDPRNCVMLCGHGTTGCHGWVENNPNAAEAEGFHVRPWNDPNTVPIKRWDRYLGQPELVYLIESGHIERATA